LPSDVALFKRVYKHTFICSKEKGQKALALDNAVIYWQLLFSPPGMSWKTASTNWLDLWIDFLQTKWKKSVNKDMWNQTLEFWQKCIKDETLSFWSEDGAWPSVIDDFVAYIKEQRGPAGADKMETD
jgi:DCN1-like protein 1/2